MPTSQGDLALLNDPVAQELLHAKIPARLAYTWTDGTPRVVPINFHWDGETLVLASPADAPKVPVLERNPQVAITIDTEGFPAKVLLIRGTALLQKLDAMPAEYVAGLQRNLGEEAGAGAAQQMDRLVRQWARIAIRPEWVGIIDFQQRWPSAIERAMAAPTQHAAPALSAARSPQTHGTPQSKQSEQSDPKGGV